MERHLKSFFEETRRHSIPPWERYIMFELWRQQAGIPKPKIYISHTVSSGGYALVEERSNDLWLPNVIKKNNQLAEGILNVLQRQGDIKHSDVVILPSDSSPIVGYGEIDYMLSLYHMISRPDIRSARTVEEQVRKGLHSDINNYNLTREMRSPYYEEMTQRYVDEIRSRKILLILLKQ